MTTKITTATLFGSDGAYLLGIEYLQSAGLCRVVRRPTKATRVLGYGFVEGQMFDPSYAAQSQGRLVAVDSWDGPMSEWRVGKHEDALRVTTAPTDPPYMGHLPDEDHGYSWGPPIELPSSCAPRYTIGDVEVSADAALAAVARYTERCAAWEAAAA